MLVGQNLLESWLKQWWLGPTQNFWFLRSAGWAGEFAFLTLSQVTLMLSVWRLHFENHCSVSYFLLWNPWASHLRDTEIPRVKERFWENAARSLWLVKGKKASISQDWTKSFHVVPACVGAPVPFQSASRRINEQFMCWGWGGDKLTSCDEISVETYSSGKNAWHLFWKASFYRPSILVVQNGIFPLNIFQYISKMFSNLFLDSVSEGHGASSFSSLWIKVITK